MKNQGKLAPILAIIGLSISLCVLLLLTSANWNFAEENYIRRTVPDLADTPAMANLGSTPSQLQMIWGTFVQSLPLFTSLLLYIIYTGRLLVLSVHRLRGNTRIHRRIPRFLYRLPGALITCICVPFNLNAEFDSWDKVLLHALSFIMICTYIAVPASLPLAPHSSDPLNSTAPTR